MNFRQYLKSQSKADNPIGDLARDALADKGWSGDSYTSLENRMLNLVASSYALKALKQAYKEFNQIRNKK